MTKMRTYQVGTDPELYGNTATDDDGEHCAAIIAEHARDIIADRGWDIEIVIGHDDLWDRDDADMETLTGIIERDWIDWVAVEK